MDRPGTCTILDKKYNLANSSCHFGSYGSIWTGQSPKKYYIGPYNIFLVTDRSIYCHMTLSAMNYLLYTATCSINVYTLATNCTWRCWSQANPFWDSKPELFSDITCLRIPYQPCIVLFGNFFSGTPASNRRELRLHLNVVPTGAEVFKSRHIFAA